MKISGKFKFNLAHDLHVIADNIRRAAYDHENEMNKAEKTKLLKIAGEIFVFSGLKGEPFFETIEDPQDDS